MTDKIDRTVRWTAWSGTGIEHLRLAEADGVIRADAVVVGERGGTPYGLRYTIALDPGWIVRWVTVAPVGRRPLILEADGRGNWTDGVGNRLAALSGCIDVDLAATPFTNTIPIRRLGLGQGEARDLKVVYVPMPGLAPAAVAQRYSCLAPGRSYCYDGLFRDFSAVLEVDEDGLVIDYPETFRRLSG
jgi:hypothetical protein